MLLVRFLKNTINANDVVYCMYSRVVVVVLTLPSIPIVDFFFGCDVSDCNIYITLTTGVNNKITTTAMLLKDAV